MLEKPKGCCDCGTYEHCVPMCVHSKMVYVDYCVARLVAALEAGGLNPVASCCGHGKMPPTVLLEDDTWVMALTREQGEETTARYCTRTDLDDTANARSHDPSDVDSIVGGDCATCGNNDADIAGDSGACVMGHGLCDPPQNGCLDYVPANDQARLRTR